MTNPEKIVFNKVPWTEFYGAKPSDENADDGINFRADAQGRAHGLINSRTLNVLRLGAGKGDSFQHGCTVVSVASQPGGAQVIVGWQPRAEIMARRRFLSAENDREYNYRAPIDQAVILPVDDRTFEIPRGTGGMGQSMMVFSVDAKGKLLPWAAEAALMIEHYSGANLLR